MDGLSTYSVWDLLDVLGLALVFVGVVGEIIVRKVRFRVNPIDIQFAEERREVWGRRFGWILVIGLGLEIPGSTRQLHEVAALHRESLILEATNKSLGIQLATLQATIQPRTISDKNANIFIDSVKKAPKCLISVHCGDGVDNEAKAFAFHINELLLDAGYNVDFDKHVQFDLGSNFATYTSAILCYVGVTNWSEIDHHAQMNALTNAFGQIGIPALGIVFPLPNASPQSLIENKTYQGALKLPPMVLMRTHPEEIIVIVNDKIF